MLVSNCTRLRNEAASPIAPLCHVFSFPAHKTPFGSQEIALIRLRDEISRATTCWAFARRISVVSFRSASCCWPSFLSDLIAFMQPQYSENAHRNLLVVHSRLVSRNRITRLSLSQAICSTRKNT